ncbi:MULTISPECIES: hypothetical protein [unclassified Microbacterium]|uniref:hypothetical protein n=1 Tax=unclassified Microbacterium TaxID=2609290 RepID=UPI000EA976A8|nr:MULTISPECIES: hypothetical protein [unclassified Microbacterium]MBT2486422.1 hypothetical protein [Microbacterium sp. ISL-108]RKN69124.1 hypothetical protein D7252_17120 [Microbacterium sp. CGR2]
MEATSHPNSNDRWLGAAPADAVFLTQILGPTVLIGVDLGGGFIATTQLGVSGVEGGESGLAGGLINTSQQFGGALGLVLGTIAGLRTAALEEHGVAAADALSGRLSWLFLSAAALSIGGAVIVALWHRSRLTTPGRPSVVDRQA